MGGGKSQTSTQSVSIPPEVMARYNAVNARAEQVASQPFKKYGTTAEAFVAPLTQEQQAGIAQTAQYSQAAQPYFQQATGQLQQAQQQGQAGLAAAQPYMQAGYQQGQQLGQEAYGGYQMMPASFMPSYQQAQAGLQQGLGAGQQYLGGATDFALAGAQGIAPEQFSQQAIGQYMSPFMSNVVAQTMAAQAQQNAQQRAALQGEAIRAGAFGGDRAGIAQANLAYQQNLANQQTIANLLQGGYGQALGAFQQQQGVNLAAEQANRAALQQTGQALAGMGQQAFGMGAGAAAQQAALGQALAGLYGQQAQGLAGLGQQQFGQGLSSAQQQAALAQAGYGMGAGTAQALAGLGQGAQAAGLQGAQAMLAAGQIEQQTEQAGKQALYNQFLQEQGFPYQQAQFLANIAMGTGALSGSTTTTTQPAPFFSDRRVKEDIRKIGETEDGLPIHKFRYKGEDKDQTHIGYMADEVEKKHPDAVGEVDGVKYVDYAKVNERESMGGAVHGGGLGRAAYAYGGADHVDANDLQALLAKQREMFGPYMSGGPYGASPYESPRSSGVKAIIPSGGVHVPKLVTAGPAPRPRSSGLEEGMNTAERAKRIVDMTLGQYDPKSQSYKGGIADKFKGALSTIKGWTDTDTSKSAPRPKTAEELEREAAERNRAYGGSVPRVGYADGGMPYGADEKNPYSLEDKDRTKDAPTDILGDVVEAGKQQIHTLSKPGEPPKPPSSGLEDAAKAVGMGTNLAKGAGKLLGESGPLAGLLGEAGTAAGAAGAGAEAAGLGAAAAGAAEGAGLLGTLGAGAAAAGEGVMAALPFLAFLSDERTKENKRVVGELYNGEKVIAYNHPGQPTQIGVGAQHVEKRDPYSVWEDEHGLKYVDYDRATRYSGGLVPRPAFQQGGGNDPEEIANYLIGKESGFDPQARAKTSSAAGLGQFTDATARTVLQRNPEIIEQIQREGIQYDPNQRGFTAQLPENIQRQMINAHIRQQQEVLQQRGFEPTRENIRMNWFLGESGGPAFLNALREDPNGPATAYAAPDQVKANQNIFFKKDGTPRSVSEMYTALTQGGGGGGGLAGGRAQVASAEAGEPAGGEKGGLGDFLTSSRFLAPLGTGLLTMASSQSLYPGAAILQGIGAGLAATQPAEEREARIKEIKTDIAGKQQQQVQNSLKVLPDGTKIIWLKGGKFMYADEYDDLRSKGQAPELLGYVPTNAEQLAQSPDARYAPQGGAGGTGVSPTEPAKAPPGGVQLSPEALQAARDERAIIMRGGPQAQTNKGISDLWLTKATQQGTDARASIKGVGDIAQNIADNAQNEGFAAMGFGAGLRAQYMNFANTVLRSVGQPPINRLDEASQIQYKLSIVQAEMAAAGADQRSFAAMDQILGAQPNLEMSPEAATKLSADLWVARQRQIDRDNFRIAYGKPSYNSFAQADAYFNEEYSMERYQREQAAIQQLLKTDPQLLKDMRAGKLTAAQIDKGFEKTFGQPYTGISRYFVSGRR